MKVTLRPPASTLNSGILPLHISIVRGFTSYAGFVPLNRPVFLQPSESATTPRVHASFGHAIFPACDAHVANWTHRFSNEKNFVTVQLCYNTCRYRHTQRIASIRLRPAISQTHNCCISRQTRTNFEFRQTYGTPPDGEDPLVRDLNRSVPLVSAPERIRQLEDL